MADPSVGRSVALFAYLLILDGAAILFFTRGFLLTRTELPLSSNCSDISQGPSKFRSTCFPPVNPKHHNLENNASGDISSNVDDIHLLDARSDDDEDNGERKERNRDRDRDRDASGNRDRNDREQEQCWTIPAVKKAIVLIIDALRFDFVAHSRNFGGERKPWMDNLPVLQRLVEDQSSAARMFKFVADPPSTTLQRLKGLTTGGLPTFIDIGHSFGAPAIVEDNLILQLVQTGKKVIMMGDDTWTQLFPTQFTEAYPFPSFNVKDLHTVDDGVIKELFPALYRNDWDVLIGHFLGVDHVGHIFGVESSLMPEKLEQYNKVIENVVQLLRDRSGPGELFEDTLLIVMGDHGQTLNGDHGGGAPDEVESALFVMMTNRNNIGPSPSSSLPSSSLPSSCDLEDPVSGCINTFPQLDFSATLAAVLGVPFPFGSVGKVNADMFTLVAGESESEEASSSEQEGGGILLSGLKLLERYRDVLLINSWQVRRYFEAYAQSAISSFQPQDLARLEALYAKAQYLSQDQNMEFDGSLLRCTEEEHHARASAAVIARYTKILRGQVDAHRDYLSAAASLARTQWTQFGLEWMFLGLSLLVACIAVRVLALYRLCNDGGGWKASKNLLPSRAMLLGSLSSLYMTALVVLLHPLLAKTFLLRTILNYGTENLGSLFLGVLMISSVIAYFSASRNLPPDEETQGPHPTPAERLENCQSDRKEGTGIGDQSSVRTVASSLFMALHAASLFSNSYIIAEGQVIQFLIASVGFVYLRLAIRANLKVRRALCFLAINLVMSKIHTLPIFKGVILAGERQVVSSNHGVMSSLLLPSIMMTYMTIIAPLVVISWLLGRGYKKQHLWGFITLGTIIMYASIGLHWLIDDLKGADILEIPGDLDLTEISRLQLPRLVYAVTVLLIVTTVILGPLGSKGLVTSSSSPGYRELAMTRVSTALIAGSSGTIIMLLGRKGPVLALLAVLEIFVFLDLQGLTTHSRRQGKEFQEESMKNLGESKFLLSSFAPTAEWSLIAAHLFFCTGHSCAFDGLHYSAAFIGFDDFGFYQQGTLLATETFGASHVSPIFALQLLVRQISIFRTPADGGQGFDEISLVKEVTKSYLWFGLLRACVTSVTSASVFIQRRHLMVWGIFAPKYVFDAVGFLVVDTLVLMVMSVYLLHREYRDTTWKESYQQEEA